MTKAGLQPERKMSNQDLKAKDENTENQPQNAAEENASSELNESVWAVVSFDECLAANLSYAEAAKKLAESEKRGINGLCVVTNETAARNFKKA